MKTAATTPAIENLKVKEASLTIYVEMDLASIPVTIGGQYNIHSNCFYPSTLQPLMKIVDGGKVLLSTDNHDLETACDVLGWDYSETHDQIQAAVEKRDQ